MENPEKMRVLDLLEAGKITADEAANLLCVLNTGPRFMTKERRENVEEKLKQFAKDCNRFAKDVGAKTKELYKDVEPKIKRASKSALCKAAEALDNLASNIGTASEEKGEVAAGAGFDYEAFEDEPREN